jgi:uncharacterized protein YjbK
MEPNVETECKMLVSRQQFDRLIAHYQPVEFVRQDNVYYVSPDPAHLAFRTRQREGKTLFTLKRKADGRTYEYEKCLAVPPGQDEDVVNTLSRLGIDPPYRIMGRLTTYRAMIRTGQAELCFDINLYHDKLDYELEYEVKQPHDYLRAFADILAQAGLTYVPNPRSKYQRCMESLFPGK